MKLWMTRNPDLDHWLIKFWLEETRRTPRGDYWCDDDDDKAAAIHFAQFRTLTGLRTPRKGSKRRVEVSISIKDVPKKGAK